MALLPGPALFIYFFKPVSQCEWGCRPSSWQPGGLGCPLLSPCISASSSKGSWQELRQRSVILCCSVAMIRCKATTEEAGPVKGVQGERWLCGADVKETHSRLSNAGSRPHPRDSNLSARCLGDYIKVRGGKCKATTCSHFDFKEAAESGLDLRVPNAYRSAVPW